MSRSDRDQPNRARRPLTNPARVVLQPAQPAGKDSISDAATGYGRGVRIVWSVTILALLLTTVSLLAHDSAQQPASALASADTPPSGTTPQAVASSDTPAKPGEPHRLDNAGLAAAPVRVAETSAAPATPLSSSSPGAAALPVLPAGVPATPAAAGTPVSQPPPYMRPVAAVGAVAALPAAAVQLAAHPRLILDANTLATLRQRAASNTAQWQALKASCDSYAGGTVGYPTDATYPNLPNIGQGYQGSSYLPALLEVALCYQVLLPSNPTAAATYGAKGVDILMKMSAPYSTASGNQGQNPCTDNGYGIRFYGVGYGLGYDWLYGLLTTAQRTQVYTTANAWLTAWENPSPSACANFEYVHPQSNYYAGYFHAKAAIALATYDENPSGPAQWSDWLSNQFATRVQPYYALHLLGGGWPEGYGNYAPLGILNMSMPAREVMTATGQDLVHAGAPYSFPLDSADYAMHFTWPSRTYFDDRDTNHANGVASPPVGTTQVGMFQQILGALAYWGSPKSSVFRQYLSEVSAATSGYDAADPWLLFLDTDPAASTTPVNTLPLSYLAPGLGAVAARSDWTTGASWMSFRAAPYVNNPNQGEEGFDQGSLALVRGNTPLLINATGWIVHEPNGSSDENLLYNDLYGSFNNTLYFGNRQLYNIYYVRNMSGSTVVDRYGQAAYTTEGNQVRTKVSAYEDGSDYVYVQATHLEDMYRAFSAGPGVAAWARQIVYLRPNRFVVYDRTAEGSAGYDQYLAWHFPASPAAGTAGTGQKRLDVTYGGQYAGAMTVVLPTNATTTTVPLYPTSNPVKVWQVQVRAPNANTGQQWLTVFDLSTSAAAVAAASPVTITQGTVVGVWLAASDGNSAVINSTGAAGTPITGAIAYTVPAVAAHHVIAELAAATGYNITVTTSGGNQNVSVSQGGTYMSSAAGVLDFYVTANGSVQLAAPPNTKPPPVSSIPVKGFPQPYVPKG